jgi:hypothetical protein
VDTRNPLWKGYLIHRWRKEIDRVQPEPGRAFRKGFTGDSEALTVVRRVTFDSEDTMAKSKLPWRTLTPLGPSGRLDPEVVTQTLLELKAERDARLAREKERRKRARQDQKKR